MIGCVAQALPGPLRIASEEMEDVRYCLYWRGHWRPAIKTLAIWLAARCLRGDGGRKVLFVLEGPLATCNKKNAIWLAAGGHTTTRDGGRQALFVLSIGTHESNAFWNVAWGSRRHGGRQVGIISEASLASKNSRPKCELACCVWSARRRRTSGALAESQF